MLCVLLYMSVERNGELDLHRKVFLVVYDEARLRSEGGNDHVGIRIFIVLCSDYVKTTASCKYK